MSDAARAAARPYLRVALHHVKYALRTQTDTARAEAVARAVVALAHVIEQGIQLQEHARHESHRKARERRVRRTIGALGRVLPARKP